MCTLYTIWLHFSKSLRMWYNIHNVIDKGIHLVLDLKWHNVVSSCASYCFVFYTLTAFPSSHLYANEKKRDSRNTVTFYQHSLHKGPKMHAENMSLSWRLHEAGVVWFMVGLGSFTSGHPRWFVFIGYKKGWSGSILHISQYWHIPSSL